MPVYTRENASIEESQKVDEILREEKLRRKAQIASVDQLLEEASQQDLAEIRQFILQFQQYGLDINATIIEKLFEQNNHETLAKLASRRYSIGDAECLKVLKLSEGPEKNTK